MKKKSIKSKPPSRNGETFVVFLLDRSGSMGSCRQETISGFNGYIGELEKKKLDVRFTLTQFDTIEIENVHDAVPLRSVRRLNQDTYVPRGGTPLYDAMGKTIIATDLAVSAKSKPKVLFVTLTDGEENSSVEYELSSIQDLIKDREARGWTFAHIGVGMAGWAAMQRVSVGTVSASNVLNSAHGKTKKMYVSLIGATASYATKSVSGQSVSGLWKGHTKDHDEEEE